MAAAVSATGLNAGAMEAAGRCRVASPLRRIRSSATPGPGSGASLGLSSPAQDLAVGSSPSPPPSYSDSTLSLLSPLGRPGFPFDDGEDYDDEDHSEDYDGEDSDGEDEAGDVEAPGRGR